jgi:hypothetical protein
MSCPTGDERPRTCAKRDGRIALVRLLVDMRLVVFCQGCALQWTELEEKKLCGVKPPKEFV